MAPGNGNGNGVKTRDIIIRLLMWLIPGGVVAGVILTVSKITATNLPAIQSQVHVQDKTLTNHEWRIAIIEKEIKAFSKGQEKQTVLLQKILDKP